MGLSVGDGFRFGCGIMLAFLIFYLVVMAIGALIMIVMTFLGLLGGMATMYPQSLLLLLPLV
ncbi:MAG: hypothetical protein KKA73_15515 [Chloroflexi bacterium]|nr:hypothetical protein [Chloroflexota bacterium]MBU1749093.1 hypothetical protein [Chloroflexota bacterium]